MNLPEIRRNQHPLGRLHNISFGLVCIADGLVRVLSLGFFHSNIALLHTSRAAKRTFEVIRKNNETKPIQ